MTVRCGGRVTGVDAGHHPALGVAEHRLVADQLVEADGQGAEDDLRGHLLAADRGRVGALGPVQQLEPDDLLLEVDDGLPGDHDLRADQALFRHASVPPPCASLRPRRPRRASASILRRKSGDVPLSASIRRGDVRR